MIIFPPNATPEGLRMLLRYHRQAAKNEANSDAMRGSHSKSADRIAEVLRKKVGDDDCHTPEAWRKSRGLN